MNFDLTTKEGLLNAGLLASGPMGWGAFLIKEVFSDNTEKQTKAAKELIEKCRREGIRHGKIKIGKDAGGKLAAAGYGEISGHYGQNVELEFWT